MRAAIVENVRSFAAGMTQKRVRAHAVLLGLILWGAYAVNIANPGMKDLENQVKGADYLHFYVLGTVARLHDGTMLYDARRQAALAQELIHQDPGEIYLPVYGPQVSLIFLPFAELPYIWSAVAWALATIAGYGMCCWVVLRICPKLRGDRRTILMLAAAFPGLFYLVASGQNSVVALAAFTLAFFGFRAQRPLLGGMAIGLLMYKPQFGLMAAVLFVLLLEWRVIAGAVITGAGQLALGAWYYGRGAVETYLGVLKHAGQDASAPLDRMHGLKSFWEMLLPWHGAATVLYAVSALAVVAITIWCWRAKVTLELRYAVFLLGSALVSPHLTDYDLVILVPAFLFIGEYILLSRESMERDAARLLMYAVYALPLFGPMLKAVHVQLSVPAYVGLFLVLAAVIRTGTTGTAEREGDAAALSPLGA
jgi:alpha-1,2-mannosyltransferase